MAYTSIAVSQGVGTGIAFDVAGSVSSQIVRLNSGASGLSLNDLSQAKIDHAASGENAVIAGVALQTIRIYKMFFVADSLVNVKFKDGAGGTDLTGLMVNILSFTLDFDGEPWLVSSIAGAFIINLSATVGVRGRVWYRQGA